MIDMLFLRGCFYVRLCEVFPLIRSLPIEIFLQQPVKAPAIVDSFGICRCFHRIFPIYFPVDGQRHGAHGISFANGGVQGGEKIGGADRFFFFWIQKKGDRARLTDVADLCLPVIDGKLAGDVVTQGDGHIFKVLYAVVHEFAGVFPFVTAVGRPAAAENYGDQQAVVGFHGAHEAVAGAVGETGFYADGAGIGSEEGVFVAERVDLPAGDFFDGIGGFLNDTPEILIV